MRGGEPPGFAGLSRPAPPGACPGLPREAAPAPCPDTRMQQFSVCARPAVFRRWPEGKSLALPIRIVN